LSETGEVASADSARREPEDSIQDLSAEDNFIKRVFLSPTVALILVLSVFPLIWSLGISFTDIERGSTRQQVGTEAEESDAADIDNGFLGLGFNVTGRNYARLATDQRLHQTALNTVFYVVVGVVVQYVIGFGLALLLNQQFFGRIAFRTIFLLPMMMTPVAAAYTGRMMFHSTLSPLAHLLRVIGRGLSDLTGQPVQIVAPWLTDAAWAPMTIVIIDSWQWIPFMTLILLAGMQAIPDDIYEAARVDGANALSILTRITFPIMLPISITAILIRGLEIFKIIDIIVATTGGGPGQATESLAMYIFDIALTFGNYSYAAAISYVLLVMVIVFSTIFLLFGRRFVRQQTGL
jgi:multiple sugar transport system permease protein